MSIREILARIAYWGGRILLGHRDPLYGSNARKIAWRKALQEREALLGDDPIS